jgi:hypothetical protein
MCKFSYVRAGGTKYAKEEYRVEKLIGNQRKRIFLNTHGGFHLSEATSKREKPQKHPNNGGSSALVPNIKGPGHPPPLAAHLQTEKLPGFLIRAPESSMFSASYFDNIRLENRT